ncbi:ATP-binding cassette domain-containing protein [Streptomyces sp. SID5914]|nr:branched-chain amino acid ABC transporter permease/ATP-binding protein [Streptomyces sp. SID5914]MZG17098.1 ATP-binding cassette domain-containing protein [Streptomyces sp. SID5914]
MIEFLRFALLGLGAGGAYAIAAVGLLQVYRGSGVLNLSHGATAYASAALFVQTYGQWEWPFLPAALASLLLAAVIGALTQLAVMRPLRNAPPLVRMTATLGIFAVLQQGVPIVFGDSLGSLSVASYYPQGTLRLGQDQLTLSYDRITVVGITLVLGAALWFLMRRTRLGLATSAVAENHVVAASLGVDADRVATANWVLGTTLAGLAGVLLVPIIGVVTPTPFVFLVIPALAAALLGRFRSFGLTIAGGLGLGIGQSIVTRYQTGLLPADLASGWPDAFPFLVIVLVLMLRGSAFPARDEIAARLPRLGRRTVSPLAALAVAVVAAGAIQLTSDKIAGSITATAALGVAGLSLVVLTGLAGQTSLAQLAIAGVGALVAARLSHSMGWPFPVIVALAVVAGGVIGLLFAAPALRTRGPVLAIATIGVGVAIENVVLNNNWFTVNGFGGTPVERPKLGPLDISAITHPQRYAAFTVVVLVVVGYLIANLRGGRPGRRLIALRGSEHAASATGISPTSTKLAVFTLSAGIASLGGVVLAFQGDSVTYNQFSLLQSLYLVIFTLIGGIGYVLGPVVGGALAPNGLMATLLGDIGIGERWVVLASGFGLIATLIQYPHGMMAGFGRRFRKKDTAGQPVWPVHRDRPSSPAVLTVQGLTVRYGAVTAVSGLSLQVRPGEIVGLIGPNGAGKTSALDAITGYVRATTGTVSLGGTDLTRLPVHRRVRAGMGRSFQTVESFDDLTVAENLAVADNVVRPVDWLVDAVTRRPLQLEESLYHQARELGLDLDVMPDALSQGQRRLLGVLRALAARPSVLLLDEPAAGLDPTETEQLGGILREVARKQNIGMLLVEHDMSLVGDICDHVVAIDFGVTIVNAPTAEALADPRVRSAYLGDADALDEADVHARATNTEVQS